MLLPFILEGNLNPDPTLLDYQNYYYGYDRIHNIGHSFVSPKISTVHVCETNGRDCSLCGSAEIPCETIEYSIEHRYKSGEEEGKVCFKIYIFLKNMK
jgi:hypothetical protein